MRPERFPCLLYTSNADVEIMDMGVNYLSTVMIFSFGIFAEIYFERVLTSTGRTIFSMTSQLCGAITNIILDPIMIFGLLGFPDVYKRQS